MKRWEPMCSAYSIMELHCRIFSRRRGSSAELHVTMVHAGAKWIALSEMANSNPWISVSSKTMLNRAVAGAPHPCLPSEKWQVVRMPPYLSCKISSVIKKNCKIKWSIKIRTRRLSAIVTIGHRTQLRKLLLKPVVPSHRWTTKSISAEIHKSFSSLLEGKLLKLPAL